MPLIKFLDYAQIFIYEKVGLRNDEFIFINASPKKNLLKNSLHFGVLIATKIRETRGNNPIA